MLLPCLQLTDSAVSARQLRLWGASILPPPLTVSHTTQGRVVGSCTARRPESGLLSNCATFLWGSLVPLLKCALTVIDTLRSSLSCAECIGSCALRCLACHLDALKGVMFPELQQDFTLCCTFFFCPFFLVLLSPLEGPTPNIVCPKCTSFTVEDCTCWGFHPSGGCCHWKSPWLRAARGSCIFETFFCWRSNFS